MAISEHLRALRVKVGAVVVALVVAETLIGLGALHRRSRGDAVAAGFLLALAIWVVGQDLGQLYSGQATDPNTAPIIALMAIALLGGLRGRVGARVGAALTSRERTRPFRANVQGLAALWIRRS